MFFKSYKLGLIKKVTNFLIKNYIFTLKSNRGQEGKMKVKYSAMRQTRPICTVFSLDIIRRLILPDDEFTREWLHCNIPPIFPVSLAS